MPGDLSELAPAASKARLSGPQGLSLRIGPVCANVRTRLPDVAEAVLRLYADYPRVDEDGFIDFQVSVRRPGWLRTFWKPQVTFQLDGKLPFHPMPGDQGFPILEWGLNWCVYTSCHQFLIVHAAVLERGGRALILPAPSGSGKSTLCAGLLFHGWRLLSDELTLICPKDGRVVPMPRPVSLKNASIDVIAKLVPGLEFGSRVAETAKGLVAHFKAPSDAVRRAHERATPAWVVLPRYVAGRTATLQAIPRAQGFMSLIENAFNYEVFGAEGFELLARVMDRCQCFSFEYGHLPEAIERFARLADDACPAPSS
jgi:HprK-related kinase A